MKTLFIGTVVVAVLVCDGPLGAQAPATIALLDRYAAGEFEAVVGALRETPDFGRLLKDLEARAPAWLDAGGAADRDRRELAAAAFALEAARIDEWREWKRIVRPPSMEAVLSARTVGGQPVKDEYKPLNTLYWGPAPLLIEWGCRLLRQKPEPTPGERWWQLAAMAVAERSEDMGFLIGETRQLAGRDGGEVMNDQTQIKHLDHVEKRFPEELRFKLAQGIARFRVWPGDAIAAFTALRAQPDIGGEAAVRLGEILLYENKPKDAFAQFDFAERVTRDPYVLYLARYLRGTGLVTQGQLPQAETAFRSALLAWPRAQSASAALSAVLVQRDQAQAAQRVAAAMVETEPPAFDPWREFVHADDRFWPQLVGHVRREIHR